MADDQIADWTIISPDSSLLIIENLNRVNKLSFIIRKKLKKYISSGIIPLESRRSDLHWIRRFDRAAASCCDSLQSCHPQNCWGSGNRRANLWSIKWLNTSNGNFWVFFISDKFESCKYGIKPMRFDYDNDLKQR